jgi:hypothetical protein
MKSSTKILFLIVLGSSLMMCASPSKKTEEGIDAGRRYENQSQFDD